MKYLLQFHFGFAPEISTIILDTYTKELVVWGMQKPYYN